MQLETITLFAGNVEDISPATRTADDGTVESAIEVTLTDVDLNDILQEVGHENLLAIIKHEDILQYLADKEQSI